MKIVEGTLRRDTSVKGQEITFVTKDVRESDKIFSEQGDKELEVIIRPVKKKRSLDANAYYWKLVTELAKVQRTSLSEMHNIELAEYGTPQKIDGKIMFSLIRDNDFYIKDDKLHLKATSETEDRKGVTYRWFIVMKGSSEYDTKEMSQLIDGVVSDAKAAGIETLTPDQLESMKQEWKT